MTSPLLSVAVAVFLLVVVLLLPGAEGDQGTPCIPPPKVLSTIINVASLFIVRKAISNLPPGKGRTRPSLSSAKDGGNSPVVPRPDQPHEFPDSPLPSSVRGPASRSSLSSSHGKHSRSRHVEFNANVHSKDGKSRKPRSEISTSSGRVESTSNKKVDEKEYDMKDLVKISPEAEDFIRSTGSKVTISFTPSANTKYIFYDDTTTSYCLTEISTDYDLESSEFGVTQERVIQPHTKAYTSNQLGSQPSMSVEHGSGPLVQGLILVTENALPSYGQDDVQSPCLELLDDAAKQNSLESLSENRIPSNWQHDSYASTEKENTETHRHIQSKKGTDADDASDEHFFEGSKIPSESNVARHNDRLAAFFEGLFDASSPVRVLVNLCNVPVKEIDNLGDQHPHIIPYYGNKEDVYSIRFLAQDCSILKLDEFFTKLQTENELPSIHINKMIMRGVVSIVAHRHEMGFPLGNLTPENVLLIQRPENKFVCTIVAGPGPRSFSPSSSSSTGQQAPEQLLHSSQTYAEDLFSLGRIIFLLTKGQHHDFEEKSVEDHLFCISDKPEAVHLLQSLWNDDPEERLSAREVLDHVHLRSTEEQLRLIGKASDRSTSANMSTLGSNIDVSYLKYGPQSGKARRRNEKWAAMLDPELMAHMRKYRVYDNSVDKLVRLIRNATNHHPELPEALKVRLGVQDLGLGRYFFNLFPWLPIEVYKAKIISQKGNGKNRLLMKF